MGLFTEALLHRVNPVQGRSSSSDRRRTSTHEVIQYISQRRLHSRRFDGRRVSPSPHVNRKQALPVARKERISGGGDLVLNGEYGATWRLVAQWNYGLPCDGVGSATGENQQSERRVDGGVLARGTYRDSEIMPMLLASSGLRPITVLREMQRRHQHHL